MWFFQFMGDDEFEVELLYKKQKHASGGRRFQLLVSWIGLQCWIVLFQDQESPAELDSEDQLQWLLFCPNRTKL